MQQTWSHWTRAAMAVLALAALTRPARAAAAPSRPNGIDTARESAGRPRVKLNRLTFPTIPEASYYKNHLTRSLSQASARADWGAGAGSVIEYRFRVDRLDIETSDGLVRVHCEATGELPNTKNASSRLSFSGEPSQRRQLVEKVLTIVARGVITRLAQIEHSRRRRARAQ
jgi:hypothetical protein